MAKRRTVVHRRRRGKGGFLLGTLAGIAAGAAGGTVLLKRAGGPPEEVSAIVPAPVSEATGQALEVAQRAPAAAATRARGGLEAIKARWREALAEGKVAAAERERELQELYERDTKRIQPPPDAPPASQAQG